MHTQRAVDNRTTMHARMGCFPISRFVVHLFRTVHTLTGHRGEISSTQFNYAGDKCISGSIDRTCRVWDVRSGESVFVLRGHSDEVLDVSFNPSGSKLATASADNTARVFNMQTDGSCVAVMNGHEGEISKVCVGTWWCMMRDQHEMEHV